MKTGASSAAGWKLTCVVVLLLLLVSVGVGQAAELVTIPDEQGLPYYARILTNVGYTDTWAIVFYRPPDWVPDDKNLAEIFSFDIPADCPYLVEGFAIRDLPPPNPPIKQHLEEADGEVVQIWFVDGAEARADYWVDGDLTIVELLDMESLRMGFADSFLEDLHPTGGAEVTFLNLNASGHLEDGTSFSMLHIIVGSALNQASLKFK